MDEFEKFYNKALRFLSYRPRSEKEVRDNLSSKGRWASGRKKPSPELIEKVIEKLKEQKFLNDEEFVKWWVEQRTTVRPKSFRVIKMELQQKGISVEIIDSIIPDSSFIIRSELKTVKRLIQKRLSRYRGLERKEQWEKLAGFLWRRGFEYETIKDALDEVVGKGYNDDKEDTEEGS